MLKYKITTQPTTEPVTVAEAAQQCRLTASDLAADTNLTAELQRLIVAARKYAEGVVGKSLAEKTVTAVCDFFPFRGFIELPIGPIAALTSVIYTDADEATHDITSDLAIDDFSVKPRLVLKPGKGWPGSSLYPVNAIKIVYVAGAYFGGNIKAAMLLMIAHWFDNRAEVVTGQESFSIPFGAEALLGQERHPYT